jgi:DNA invertase Pin-like site-specific DNA recombinase
MEAMAVYCRVSTPGQSTPEKESLPEQEKQGRKFAEQNGFFPRIYNEGNISGTTTEREHLDRLLTDIEKGKVQGVWVWDEKRFSRSVALGATLLDYLKKHHVRFFVADKERDPSDPSVYTLLVVQFAFAQKDLNDITKRLLMGKIASANKGKGAHVGTYGYDNSFNDKGKRIFTVNEEEAKTVRELFAKFDSERPTLQALTDWLNARHIPTKRKGKFFNSKVDGKTIKISGLWDTPQVKHILTRIEYTGNTYNWDKTQVIPSLVYPPIIDPKLFERVSSAFIKTIQHRLPGGMNKSNHPLSSIIKCHDCQAPYYYGFSGKNRIPYYYHKHVQLSEKKCPSTHKLLHMHLEKVFQISFYFVFSQSTEINLYTQKYIERKTNQNKEAVEAKAYLNKQIAKIDKEIANLVNFIATGDDSPAVKEGMKSREAERKSLNRQIEEIDKSLVKMQTDIDNMSSKYSKREVDKYSNAKDSERRILYKRFIASSFIKGDCLYIAYENGKRFIVALPNKQNKQYKIDIYFKDAFSIEGEASLQGITIEGLPKFYQDTLWYDFSKDMIVTKKTPTKTLATFLKLFKEQVGMKPTGVL